MNSSRCLVAAIWIGIVTAFFPVSSDSLWLNVAQGRSVCRIVSQGHWNDIQHSCETGGIGSIPAFLAYSMGAGSGLMALKLTSVIACGFCLLRFATVRNAGTLFIVLMTMMCLRDGWDVSSIAIEIPLILIMWRIVHRWNVGGCLMKILGLVVVFILWSNLGDRVFLGFCLLNISLAPLLCDGSTRRGAIAAICITGVAVCVNPRGIFIYQDSICLTWPFLFESSIALDTAGRISLTSMMFDSIGIAFIMLVAIAGCHILVSNVSASEILCFLLVSASAILMTTNLPVAAVWIGSSLIASSKTNSSRTRVLETRNAQSERSSRGDRPLFFPRALMPLCLTAGTLFAVFSGSGYFPGNAQRYGWGIHPRLEIRPCQRALENFETNGPVWCSSLRAAGMATWLSSDESRVPTDFLRQAILAGTLQEWFLLRRDLANSREAWHKREDGSSGGWWIPIMGANTCLLMVDAMDLDLIHALEPTLWKPLSVDSPVIPFAVAGNVSANNRIIAVLGERNFLESGPWTFTPPNPFGDDLHWDIAGAITGRIDDSLVLQQAKVLRAMNLPAASLRILNPMLAQLNRDDGLLLEFARCQFQLAHNEELLMSRPSYWRHIVCQQVVQPPEFPVPHWYSVQLSTDDQIIHSLQEAAQLYTGGQLQAAFERLESEDPEHRYARAWLLLESGKPMECRELLVQTVAMNPENSLSQACQDVLTLLPE